MTPAAAVATAAITIGLMCLACAGEPPVRDFPRLAAWGEQQADPGTLAADEAELWRDAQEELRNLRKEDGLYADEPLRVYLQTLADSIVPPIGGAAPRIEIYVYSSPERNGAALPNGAILISLGALAAFDNEAELAMLIGHEAAHVLKRHSLAEVRYAEITSSHVDRMRLSRRNEREADEVGLSLALAAGYDASAAIHFLEHFSEEHTARSGILPAWSSHWDIRFRRTDLKAIVHAQPRIAGRLSSEAFQQSTNRIRLVAAQQAIEAGRRSEARELIERELARDPESGRAYYLRAQVARLERPDLALAQSVGDDYRRAVALTPDDPDALRALGLFELDSGQVEASKALLRRYLEARPEAIDRKIIERYIGSGSAIPDR